MSRLRPKGKHDIFLSYDEHTKHWQWVKSDEKATAELKSVV